MADKEIRQLCLHDSGFSFSELCYWLTKLVQMDSLVASTCSLPAIANLILSKLPGVL